MGKTKHAEIAERAKTQGLDGSVEELKVVRNKDKVKYDAKKEVYDKANVKLGLAKKVLVSVKDHHEAVKSKEAGIKQSIAKGKADLKKMVDADKTIRENEKRAVATNQKAKSQRDAAVDAYKRAFAEEKNSKNDALERTKKQEASAITRAVEKKNKASEAEAKAYEKRAVKEAEETQDQADTSAMKAQEKRV